MKKIIIIAGALCMLASFPANAQTSAQVIFEFPQGNNWRDVNNDRYWRQVRLNQEAEELARHQASERERYEHHDNGNHYAYGKGHSKKHGKGYNKNHPKRHNNQHNQHNER